MVAFQSIPSVAWAILSIASGTLANPVALKFQDTALTSKPTKGDGWDGVKAYPWSIDCGASDSNWEGPKTP